jgi:phasin
MTMTEATKKAARAVQPSSAFDAKFEMPKFEMPNLEMPKLEVPAAFREIAEKGVAQARENYDKIKAAAEEATELLEDAYASATKGGADYSLKVLEAARANANAAFDFAAELLTVKSFSEMVELTSTHTRRQFETLAAQTKELTALAQKVATDTTEPIKSGVSKAFKVAA